MKALIKSIQKIDAKHLFFAGGISAVSGLAATVFSGSSFAVWLLVICVVSAAIFFALIAIKVAYSLLNSIVSIVKRPHTRNTGKSKRNVPLIVVGLVTLIAISSLRAQLGGGVAVSIIQVCALVIILYGFGMSWTRKNKRHDNTKSRHDKSNSLNERVKASERTSNPDAYGTILQGVTIKIVNDLQDKHHLTETQANNLVVRIMGFCIIMLMRDLQDASVEPRKSREFISEVLRTIAKNSNPPELEQKAYTELNRLIGELSRKYGSLPLSNANSGNLGGTLLWEYSKLMNETMGKDKNDLILLMENTSVITNLNQAIETQGIVTALKANTVK